MDKDKIAAILGGVCLLLTIGICVQMKTIKQAENEIGKNVSGNNSGLRDEVLTLRDKYNSTYEELEKAEMELEQARIQAISNNAEDAKKEEQLKLVNKILGYTGLTGPGVIIELDDNRNVSSEQVLDISQYLVHEPDLIKIINELFNAGVDAISINDQRIISTTEIMCNGNIIRINGEMIGAPFNIKAIGFIERIRGAIERPGGYLETLKNEGVIVEIKYEDTITIPKYDGVYKSDYIN